MKKRLFFFKYYFWPAGQWYKLKEQLLLRNPKGMEKDKGRGSLLALWGAGNKRGSLWVTEYQAPWCLPHVKVYV